MTQQGDGIIRLAELLTAGLYIRIMKKYNFNGYKVEIDETTIEVETDGIVLHPDRMTIDANIIYNRADGKTDVDTIYEIPVQNMNFEPASLQTRTMKRLEDFDV